MTARRVVGGLASAALLIAVVTVVSRVVGFGRWLVFSKTVGDTCLGDVYNTANLLPNIVFEVVAGGALAGAVVPLLVGPLGRSDRAEAGRVLSGLLTWTLAVLVPFALLLGIFARPLVGVFLGDAGRCGPEAVDLGTRMLQVFAPQVPLYGLAVVMGGALQARRRFLPSAAAPIVGSLVVIPVYLLFAAAGDGDAPLGELSRRAELTLSVGTTLGVVGLALAIVLPAVRRSVWLPLRPTLRFPPGVAARARALALAGVAALLAQQGTALVITWLANREGTEGAFTRYTWAWQLYLLPYAILVVPLATSVFQRLATVAEAGGAEEYAQTVARSTRVVLLAAGAGAAALAAASWPAAQAFSLGPGGADAGPLAAGLVAFAPGLLGYALVAHLGRALYAQHRGRAAAAAIVTGWAAVAVADVALVRAVTADRVEAALGWGNTIGMTIAGVLLVAVTVRLFGRKTMAGVGRSLLAAVVGGGVGAGAGYLVGERFADVDFVPALLGGALAGAVAIALCGLVMAALDRATVASVLASSLPGRSVPEGSAPDRSVEGPSVDGR